MRITTLQFFWILAVIELSMTIWLTISPTISAVQQDAWISILIGGLIGLVTTFIYARLSAMHPGHTLVGICRRVFGKWLGTVVMIYFMLGWFSVTVVILRAMTDFIQLVLFNKTSNWVICLIMIANMLYISYRGGLAAIGRFSQITGPLFFTIVLLTLILNVINLEYKLALPVMHDHSVMKVMHASLVHTSFLSESILITMLIPLMIQSGKASKTALWAVGISSTLVLLTTASVTMTFGSELSGQFIYPFFNMVRFISVLEFIQNMDVWVIFVWLFGVFVKLSVYLTLTSHGIAELANRSIRKKSVLFLIAAYFVCAMLPMNIANVITDYYNIWLPYIYWPNMVVIPCLLLIISLIRRKQLAN
ncbi:spore germination protein [Paenibacillus glycanilyticus]|uniref:GerAB/ArcD/ProY family transporter n=1 Tax=Paenibacillus glycanilyticus TaxID=126569 RepID=UPI00203FE3B9|nr:endospore germination permease [Paenibacillus glycanilyticus]MCM3628407.1 spore germination protein [Paenibacillus glycanilyticus]